MLILGFLPNPIKTAGIVLAIIAAFLLAVDPEEGADPQEKPVSMILVTMRIMEISHTLGKHP